MVEKMKANKAAWAAVYKLYDAALEEAQRAAPYDLWLWFWSQAGKIMDAHPGKLTQGLVLAVFEQLEAVAADIAAGTTDTPELQRKDEKTT